MERKLKKGDNMSIFDDLEKARKVELYEAHAVERGENFISIDFGITYKLPEGRETPSLYTLKLEYDGSDYKLAIVTRLTERNGVHYNYDCKGKLGREIYKFIIEFINNANRQADLINKFTKVKN